MVVLGSYNEAVGLCIIIGDPRPPLPLPYRPPHRLFHARAEATGKARSSIQWNNTDFICLSENI